MTTITASLLARNPDYIFPLAVNVATALLPVWMGLTVGKARAKVGLKYPNEYCAGNIDEKTDLDKFLFNCTQRSHHVTPPSCTCELRLMAELP
jgi:hypothetical protein